MNLKIIFMKEKKKLIINIKFIINIKLNIITLKY